jgi:hypothetical protein
MELFGNSTFRYRQFDGMIALPYKSQKGYHLPGKIRVSDNDSFLRTALLPDSKKFKVIIGFQAQHEAT